MFDNKSEYAMNKREKDRIVYQDACGNIIRLSVKDFTSADEFMQWKEWLDEWCHAEENANHIYYNHTVGLSELLSELYTAEATDNHLLEQENSIERAKLVERCLSILLRQLTEKQYRRMQMYYIDGKTLCEIAECESTSYQSIAESLASVRKKMKTIYEQTLK